MEYDQRYVITLSKLLVSFISATLNKQVHNMKHAGIDKQGGSKMGGTKHFTNSQYGTFINVSNKSAHSKVLSYPPKI